LSHGTYLPCAPKETLKQLFPQLDLTYTSSISLPTQAETAEECHARVKKGLDILIHTLDSEKNSPHTILLSGHAASAICAVRALLNDPHYYVHCGTCSLSHLVRQPDGSWTIFENGDCKHLSKGEQRSWMFSGDVPDYEKKTTTT
jgi:transcription factor C subunit 7